MSVDTTLVPVCEEFLDEDLALFAGYDAAARSVVILQGGTDRIRVPVSEWGVVKEQITAAVWRQMKEARHRG